MPQQPAVSVPAAIFGSGYRVDEYHAIVGDNHSSFVDKSQVRAERLPIRADDQVAGRVLGWVVQAGPEYSLVELPGVAVASLRGLVLNADIEPW